MKMLSNNLRVEHVNIYEYIFVYVYICIYANGIYIPKSCSIWTVCPCFLDDLHTLKREKAVFFFGGGGWQISF